MHDLAKFALNLPDERPFAEVPEDEVCRGTAAERERCDHGAGPCARDISCFD